IYTMPVGASEPSKLEVEIVTDDYRRKSEKVNRSHGATDMAVSPDGEEVAFVVRGDVYVTSTKYNTTRRITDTPQQERRVDFSSDGRTLVYDSERDGIWQLFTATIKDPEEKKFTYATEIVEIPLYKSDKPAFQPRFSPDGKEVAFLEDRTELRVINLDTKKVRTVLDGKYNYSYTDGDVSFEWSPDSRWFLTDYIGVGGWNNSDVALVKADGSEVYDLTESGYSDGNAKWALDGKAMIWSTDRNGYRSHGSWGSQREAFIMFFDADAYDRFRMNEEERALIKDDKKEEAAENDKAEKKDSKKNKKKDKKTDDGVKPLEFDIENARYRVLPLIGYSSSLGDFAMDKKGEKFFYITSANNSTDLWMKDIVKGDRKVLTKGAGFGSLIPDAKGENLYMLGNGMSKISMGSGEKKNIDFKAWADYSPYAEREYIYDHAWQQVKDKFYDADIHGVDWEKYGEAYRRFLPHITNNNDFAELLSELLGELNASHTGARYYGDGARYSIGNLGAFFDDSFEGPGLKVTEVIKRGPLSYKSANVKPGDVILAIDGTEIAPGMDYSPLLEGRVNVNTLLTVKHPDGKTENVKVKPIAPGELSDLLYRRWVEHNQAVVDSVSGGRVAYVHVEGMDSPSFREVFSELLGKYRNREAVVVDTRYNGGGWLHNDIAVLLSGKEYVRFAPRGRYIGSEPFTRWTKPSVMLVNESNYSDAHGTPYTYRTLGIGKIVGAPVPGTMTAVWWETQIDPSLVFGVPQVTSLDMNGNVLENQQLNPDIIIYNKPEDVIRGVDAQLIGATRELLRQLDEEKK
ncbi:MAG: PDZ domain-containing protein, partial [Muribaculaceae bacterium]|nr:PDZ domain-containing protein [Muribaculaceae bacterium]